jgi:hypothetical protein
MAAARSPPRSDPANNQALRPSAMPRSARSAALLVKQMRPSSRKRVNAAQRLAEGLVGGEGFAIDAGMIKADANRQRSVPGSEWQVPSPISATASQDQPRLDCSWREGAVARTAASDAAGTRVF